MMRWGRVLVKMVLLGLAGNQPLTVYKVVVVYPVLLFLLKNNFIFLFFVFGKEYRSVLGSGLVQFLSPIWMDQQLQPVFGCPKTPIDQTEPKKLPKTGFSAINQHFRHNE